MLKCIANTCFPFCLSLSRWPSVSLPKLSTPSPTVTGYTLCTGTWSRKTWCSLRSRASSSSPTLASATAFTLGKNSPPPVVRWPTLLLKYCWGTSTTLPLWVSLQKWQSDVLAAQRGEISLLFYQSACDITAFTLRGKGHGLSPQSRVCPQQQNMVHTVLHSIAAWLTDAFTFTHTLCQYNLLIALRTLWPHCNLQHFRWTLQGTWHINSFYQPADKSRRTAQRSSC